MKIMCVRVKGTDVGIRIYVDSDMSFEYNKKVAVEAARKLLRERSITEIGCYIGDCETVGEIERVDLVKNIGENNELERLTPKRGV
jgi:hypothetical protein